ncbi:ABC transporter substrate-binding protein [[Clostridium] symbiosum]|uniref:ABC transporter substrate-binding protein n=1 Tax=Clostridium symbiosum TaxID=1512 RepID=UPI001D078024|nr:ABC transporter substrate-binding protein [[Clostridium] symbiosum]MCB6611107.1 ABC transporter substrate-binding protein [[Clostridium] symbiosum]MCB6930251.1 ABC transporter substrate-binding protein [[Clostridium] symbiosum]
MKKMKKVLAVVLTAAMVLGLAACGKSGGSGTGSAAEEKGGAVTEAEKETEAEKAAGETEADSQDTIKIGVILSFTGSAAYESEMLKQGYDFAAEYWNSNGGVKALGGKKLEMIYADHADDVETGVTELERLLDEGCSIISGDYSSGSVTLAMQPICERRKVPFVVSQQSALEVYTEGNEWVFNPTNDASTNAQGLVGVIKMIAEMYGDEVHGVGFIAENSEWGQSQMASFVKYFEEAGIQIAYKEFYELGTTDFTTQVTKMKAADVQYLIPVVSGLEEGVSLYRTVKEYELDAGFFCCGGVIVTDEFKEAVGESANGIFSTDTWNPGFLEKKGEKSLAVHQLYVDEHGYNMNENAGCAWNSVAVMMAALEAAGSTDGSEIQKALKEMDLKPDSPYMIMTQFDGMKFGYPDNNGNYGHNIYGLSTVSQLIDGTWRMVWPNEMLKNNPIIWPVE